MPRDKKKVKGLKEVADERSIVVKLENLTISKRKELNKFIS